MVDATVKDENLQLVQLLGQASRAIRAGNLSEMRIHLLLHSCLLLSATRVEPEQTPFPSVPTQLPFSVYFPAPQMIQSFEVAPLHVWQRGEQGSHAVPLLKLASGHTVPEEVVVWDAKH